VTNIKDGSETYCYCTLEKVEDPIFSKEKHEKDWWKPFDAIFLERSTEFGYEPSGVLIAGNMGLYSFEFDPKES
jgi:hypothetical protein